MTLENSNIIKDYSHFLSKRGKLKQPSPIRSLFQYSNIPGMISLGGGFPNAKTFPFKSMVIELKDGSKLNIGELELQDGLQYSPTPGLPKLQQLLKNLQSKVHNLPPSDTKGQEWNLIISTGSQESLSNAIEVLLDDGDSILTENPTYSGTLSILRPLSLNICGIETDKYGMIPSKLEKTLNEWDHSRIMPKVLYVIPSGQNPSGTTMNYERKKEIYEIASRFNLLILEDDPYYYLQFESEGSGDAGLGRSFLSMDVDRRVLRFDSFSKILSSGLRIGFITGNQVLIDVINYHQQASTLHASGISQSIVLSLLNEWGLQDGTSAKWNEHLSSIQSFYREKRDQFIKCLNDNLNGQIEYNVPCAGMFVWIKLLGIKDSKELIFSKAIEKKIILVPGISFSTDLNTPSPYVRASFSTATFDQMNEATKRLSQILTEELKKQ